MTNMEVLAATAGESGELRYAKIMGTSPRESWGFRQMSWGWVKRQFVAKLVSRCL